MSLAKKGSNVHGADTPGPSVWPQGVGTRSVQALRTSRETAVISATSALPFPEQKRKRRLRVAPCPKMVGADPGTETQVFAVYLAAPR